MPDYKVTVAGGAAIPVRAHNPTSARNHAVRQQVKVEKLTTDDAIAFGRAGVDLQIAGEDAPEDEAETRVNVELGVIETRSGDAWAITRPATLEELQEADGLPAEWRVDPKGGMVQRKPAGGDSEADWADIREATPEEVAAAKPPKK